MPTLVDICFAISPLDAGPLTLTPNLSGMDVTLGGSLIKHISDSPAGTFTQDAMGHFTHHVTHDAAGNALEWDLSDGHLVGTAHSDGLGHVSFHDPFGALQGTLEGGSAGHATYSDANHAHVFDFHHGMSLDASPGFGSDDGFHGQDWSSATHNDFGSVAAFEAPATSHAFLP